MTPSEQAVNIALLIDIGEPKCDLVVIHTVQGEPSGQVIKTRLESERIPVLLKYESIDIVHRLTIDSLREVRIFVPEKFLDYLRNIGKLSFIYG